MMTGQAEPLPPGRTRLQLSRDVLIFQVKLLVDGVRDLLLVPLSVVAGILGIMSTGPRAGSQFYDLLHVGRKSEHWINLFGAIDDRHGEGKQPSGLLPSDIDDLVDRVESFVVDEYRHGGITGAARERLDNALKSLRARAGRPPPSA